MKDNGKMGNVKDMAFKYGVMDLGMKDNGKIIKLMEKVSSFIQMEMNMMVIG
jgi:hypothetical protein